MKIVVVGAGYVGLVTSACLADQGHSVICVDSDARKVQALTGGRVAIREEGLNVLVGACVQSGRLRFCTDLRAALSVAEVVIIAVGTPARPDDGAADMRSIDDVIQTIARYGSAGLAVLIKSTVPVGTGDRVERLICTQRADDSMIVVSNPEFLRQGCAISDFRNPNRIIVGIADPAATSLINELYAPMIACGAPIAFMTRCSAELVKYASNSFLAMKITYANELADLCEKVGADIRDVIVGMGHDARIGNHFLNVGPGFGGSCFPKDISALLYLAKEAEKPLELLAATDRVNRRRIHCMLQKIEHALDGCLANRTVCALGLAFKAGTDDLRDSPAVTIIRSLQANGARVSAYDPAVSNQTLYELPGVNIADDPYHAAQDADLLLILTDWTQFRALDFPALRKRMRKPTIVDLRNVLCRHEVIEHGFSYAGLGDGQVS